jgi:hypothetical protein
VVLDRVLSGCSTYDCNMSMRRIQGKVLALVLAALIIGFTPLVHAMCVGQTPMTTSAHMMADGSAMAMPSIHQQHQQLHQDQAEVSGTGIISNSGVQDGMILLGLIALSLAPACLAKIRVWFSRSTRREKQKHSAGNGPPNWRLPAILHRPTMVDLVSLGISRT